MTPNTNETSRRRSITITSESFYLDKHPVLSSPPSSACSASRKLKIPSQRMGPESTSVKKDAAKSNLLLQNVLKAKAKGEIHVMHE
eukprot:309424-Hanusia_phi.AAC.3